MDYIHFFGTTGNKDIFFKNIRSAGGLYLDIDDTHIVIDPGVNTFYKYIHRIHDKWGKRKKGKCYITKTSY